MTTPASMPSSVPPRSRGARSPAGPLIAALIATGCGTRPGPSGDPGAGSSAPGLEPARAIEPITPITPTARLVRAAFADHVPAFPLLSGDRHLAAVGIASPVAGGAAETYRVELVTSWAGVSDPWGATGESYPIIDPTMAAMLLDHGSDPTAPLPDPGTLRSRAEPITRKLTAGGFTPFERMIALGPEDTSLGPVTLRLTHDPRGALIVRLLAAPGAELARHEVAPATTGTVAGAECVSAPVARRAWLDTARSRVLVEVTWRASAAACNTPDPEYGLWAYR